MSDEVLVIRTDDIERAKEFLEHFGMTFVQEQHGKGPVHYACEHAGKVLEIYPVGTKEPGLQYL